MQIVFDTSSIESYRQFLAVKRLPHYWIRGRVAWFPDEYASMIGMEKQPAAEVDHTPADWMFDYQAAISSIAIRKQKYAIFADCGLGKTGMFLEFAKAALEALAAVDRGVLILSPLNVIEQTIGEAKKFYGDSLPVEQVPASKMQEWLLNCGGKVGITNYEALQPELRQGQLGAMIIDESSVLKSHYGKWGQVILQLGKGLEWKLCCTGTPAPNDRIEYANHAVFLDKFPTINAFLATYFVNRGQTSERWVLKPHALRSFYRALSDWCIFLTNPATYGWKDNSESIPPIHVHVHDVPMTADQDRAVRNETGQMFATSMGGIGSRGVLGQIGKGHHRGQAIETNKPAFIRGLLESWPDESTIIWCLYNEEQKLLERTFPGAVSITGTTPYAKRMEGIHAFQRGERRTLISKPKILGFGLNLQVCTRQVFSGLQDSYEQYYQAVKRSNRYGSTRPLNVHIPVTDVEEPMVQNVLAKAARVQADTEEQERLFKELATCLPS